MAGIPTGLLQIGKLQLFPERYLAGFRAYDAAIVDRQENYYRLVGSKVPDTILCESGTDVRVLGIGSGSGEIDILMLKKLLQHHSSVYNRVVEPSGDQIGRYKSLVREDTSLSAVKFDWRQQTAEDCFQTKEDTKFHLIHAIHVLYLVEDLHATLRDMWEQLADGGYMLVALEPEKGGLGKLWRNLKEAFVQGDHLKTPLRTTSDVKQWLESRGIRYVTSEDEVNFDVTECFKEESEMGRLLLDFLILTPGVSNNEPEIKAKVLELLRRNSSVIDDKIFLQSITEVIVTHKSG